MPETDGHIIFDSYGVCNCCQEAKVSHSMAENEVYGINELKKIISSQLQESHGKYD